jgi:hypothetical protein
VYFVGFDFLDWIEKYTVACNAFWLLCAYLTTFHPVRLLTMLSFTKQTLQFLETNMLWPVQTCHLLHLWPHLLEKSTKNAFKSLTTLALRSVERKPHKIPIMPYTCNNTRLISWNTGHTVRRKQAANDQLILLHYADSVPWHYTGPRFKMNYRSCIYTPYRSCVYTISRHAILCSSNNPIHTFISCMLLSSQSYTLDTGLT